MPSQTSPPAWIASEFILRRLSFWGAFAIAVVHGIESFLLAHHAFGDFDYGRRFATALTSIWGPIVVGWAAAFVFSAAGRRVAAFAIAFLACLSVGFPLHRLEILITAPDVERILSSFAGPFVVVLVLWLSRGFLLATRPAASEQCPVQGKRRIALALLFVFFTALTAFALVVLFAVASFDNNDLAVVTTSLLAAETLVSLIAAIGLGASRPWGRLLAEIYAFSLLGGAVTLAPVMVRDGWPPLEIRLGGVVILVGFAIAALLLLKPRTLH